MPAARGWTPEWAGLGHAEIRKRVEAEFCEYCGAVEHQPCMSKNKTTLFDYRHRARYEAAMERLNAERSL